MIIVYSIYHIMHNIKSYPNIAVLLRVISPIIKPCKIACNIIYFKKTFKEYLIYLLIVLLQLNNIL